MEIDLFGTINLGLSLLFSPEVLFFLTVGVIGGLIIGAIPGLNDNIAFAVFIPFAFSMKADTAMALMVGVYCSACIGGSIPAIMVRVPGTASALLTCIDGNAHDPSGQGRTGGRYRRNLVGLRWAFQRAGAVLLRAHPWPSSRCALVRWRMYRWESWGWPASLG